MDMPRLRRQRLRSHRLTAPARTVAGTAAHMMATQGQEFWGGRWALAARTAGEPTLRDVDAAFDRGEIVRTWTMRGTLHIVIPGDAARFLAVTRERQLKQFAPVHRSLGIDAAVIATAERAARAALNGGNRLTRAEFAQVLSAAGIDPAGMRGNHLLSTLALRGVLVLGPVVPREGAPTRDQYLVTMEDALRDVAGTDAAGTTPNADPLAELFVGYIRSHGPAGEADFAWWAGLPKGLARQARVGAADRVTEIADGLFAASAPPPRRRASPDVVALPPFEEYFLSYADRTVPCAPEFLAAIGPTANGIVRPIVVADGEIVGVWSHSVAVGKHHLLPEHEVFGTSVDAASVDAALTRYARFIRG